MEATVPLGLEFSLTPERLDQGSSEERAAFGLFLVRTAQQSLTEGFDFFVNGFRQGPLVSGYHVAEWLIWNWWRLRWEPRSAAPDWSLAHSMTSIGEGYIWPNLDIWSDGVRTMLISQPSSRPDAKPFRYVGAAPTVVPSTLFEAAIDEFLPRVIGRLREERLPDTNLDRLWQDLLTERTDPDIATRRRLEALMGRDPDAIEDGAIEQLVADSVRLGESSVREIAAEQARNSDQWNVALTAQGLEATAHTIGCAASPRDALTLHPNERLPRQVDVPAWRLGVEAANAVRRQDRIGDASLSDQRLAQMAGTTHAALVAQPSGDAALSYALDNSTGTQAWIVLAGRHATARRFALARVVGDRLMQRSGALHPATHAYTYRQKAQRAFAAELLAPFDVVEEILHGDYSEDRQLDAADHFSVSPMVINTLLKNHGRIERDLPGEEFYITPT